MEVRGTLSEVPLGGFVVAEEISERGAKRFLHAPSAGAFLRKAGVCRGCYHELLRYPCRLAVGANEGQEHVTDEMVSGAARRRVCGRIGGEV